MLNIERNKVNSLIPLRVLPKLTKLLAGHNRLRTLEGVQECTHLQEVSVESNYIDYLEDAMQLRGCSDLVSASLKWNPFTVAR